MKNTVLILLVCVVFLAGCSKKAEDSSFETVRLSEEKKFYNEYLGISYSIPRGWWLYDLNEANFSEAMGNTNDHVSLDIFYDEFENYNYSNIWLVNFGNLESSTSHNHLGFTINAWYIDEISNMPAYMEYFEVYMLEPTEDEEYVLIESEQYTINEKVFEMRNYLVSREVNDFYLMTLSCEAGNGYFLNIFVDYWPENTRAKQDVFDSISKAIEFFR